MIAEWNQVRVGDWMTYSDREGRFVSGEVERIDQFQARIAPLFWEGYKLQAGTTVVRTRRNSKDRSPAFCWADRPGKKVSVILRGLSVDRAASLIEWAGSHVG